MWRVVCDFRKDFFIIINFICQDKRRKTDCITTEYNMVTYVEQEREAQKCCYLGPKQNRN